MSAARGRPPTASAGPSGCSPTRIRRVRAAGFRRRSRIRCLVRRGGRTDPGARTALGPVVGAITRPGPPGRPGDDMPSRTRGAIGTGDWPASRPWPRTRGPGKRRGRWSVCGRKRDDGPNRWGPLPSGSWPGASRSTNSSSDWTRPAGCGPTWIGSAPRRSPRSPAGTWSEGAAPWRIVHAASKRRHDVAIHEPEIRFLTRTALPAGFRG